MGRGGGNHLQTRFKSRDQFRRESCTHTVPNGAFFGSGCGTGGGGSGGKDNADDAPDCSVAPERTPSSVVDAAAGGVPNDVP